MPTTNQVPSPMAGGQMGGMGQWTNTLPGNTHPPTMHPTMGAMTPEQMMMQMQMMAANGGGCWPTIRPQEEPKAESWSAHQWGNEHKKTGDDKSEGGWAWKSSSWEGKESWKRGDWQGGEWKDKDDTTSKQASKKKTKGDSKKEDSASESAEEMEKTCAKRGRLLKVQKSARRLTSRHTSRPQIRISMTQRKSMDTNYHAR